MNLTEAVPCPCGQPAAPGQVTCPSCAPAYRAGMEAAERERDELRDRLEAVGKQYSDALIHASNAERYQDGQISELRERLKAAEEVIQCHYRVEDFEDKYMDSSNDISDETYCDTMDILRQNFRDALSKYEGRK